MLVLFLFGFSGGLPLMLTGQTLQAWMTHIHLDLKHIAVMSLVGLPYTLKPLWALVVDRYRLPLLGRRRGWCLVFQLALVITIAVMGLIDPIAAPVPFAGAAVAVAFFSASQDIMIDAYKADILEPHERAAGNSMYVLGYRAALIISGAVALVLADHMPWSVVYVGIAVLMVVGIVATLIADEPVHGEQPPRTMAEAIVRPFKEFFKLLGGLDTVLVLAFAMLYRFGDYFVQALNQAFFLRGVKFSLTEVGIVTKVVGFVGGAIGGVLAGGLVARFGLRRMLLSFGVLAAATNLLYAWLAVVGHDLGLFCLSIGVDHLSTALGTAAFLSVLTAVCSPAVSATQFALLTALSSVGQRVFGPFAADIVDWVGWSGYFIATAVMAIPGLILAWLITRPGGRLPS